MAEPSAYERRIELKGLGGEKVEKSGRKNRCVVTPCGNCLVLERMLLLTSA